MTTPSLTSTSTEEKITEKLYEHGLSISIAAVLASELCSFLERKALPSPASFSFQHPRETVLAALVCMEVASQQGGSGFPPVQLRDMLADFITFVVQGQPPLEVPEKEASPEDRWLLLVDDDTNVRASLADFLSSLGYHVETAGSGEEALGHLARSSYDAILTDVVLPGIDGWELAQKIRDQNLQPVILLLSGWRRAPSEDEERMRLVDGFVEKPVDPQALANLLRRLLIS